MTDFLPKFEFPKFDLPKMDVPEGMREFAEKGVAQTRQAYEKAKATAEEATRVLEEANRAHPELDLVWTDVQRKWIEHLDALVDAMYIQLDDYPAYRQSDVLFHVGLAECTGSQPQEQQDFETDVYKLGLAVIRCLKPESGATTPASILIRVDFPAPFSPRMAWIRPANTTRSALASARTPP